MCFDINEAERLPYELVLIVMWVHLFPSRTQKLSSFAPTIVAGRLAVKIGNANTRPPQRCGGHFLSKSVTAASITEAAVFICSTNWNLPAFHILLEFF